ncbi:sensor histidine kinase [Actinomadura rudentiformis]|uniref:histidine kinase n=1 Tax=Actinomadura rudentiformis TaxID=359158 RepID=A0A6H9Z5D6_9ACTN|nr:HAMP domain-containing sensor histidine kinase [Actinomadura rudentiformis]KAB2352498.1 HAMP domain-containing histidine kinase [Actinomadura rudentiformis]
MSRRGWRPGWRRRSRPRSLRAQLTTVNVLLFALGLALFSVAGVNGLDRFLVGAADESLSDARSTVQSLNVDLARIQGFADLGAELDAVPGSRRTSPGAASELIFIPLARGGEVLPLRRSLPPDKRQQALARAAGDPQSLADGGTETVRSRGTRYRVTTLRLADGNYVLLALSLEPADRAVRRLLLLNAIAGGALLLVLAVVSRVESRRRLRPLGDMVHTASAIAEGDLARRVADRGPPSAEVEELRGALNAMLHQIEAAFEMRERSDRQLRRFVADASHELRTPLAAIRGYLQLSGKGMLHGRERDRAMARMTAEADRMARLVDDLLALARLDQSPQLRPARVDLARLVHEAVADLRAVQPARPVRVDVPDGGLAIEGDETVLTQIVGNLLANVRAHTPEETRAHVVLRRGTGWALLEVADDGPGMDPDDADRVFDRFFRAGGGGHGGSGLGMAIVRAAAEAHGGTATVHTAPGEGFTTTIRLPLL